MVKVFLLCLCVVAKKSLTGCTNENVVKYKLLKMKIAWTVVFLSKESSDLTLASVPNSYLKKQGISIICHFRSIHGSLAMRPLLLPPNTLCQVLAETVQSILNDHCFISTHRPRWQLTWLWRQMTWVNVFIPISIADQVAPLLISFFPRPDSTSHSSLLIPLSFSRALTHCTNL